MLSRFSYVIMHKIFYKTSFSTLSQFLVKKKKTFNLIMRSSLKSNIFFSFSAPESLMHCFFIDYFSKDDYSPDPNDSTLAIPCKCQSEVLFQ